MHFPIVRSGGKKTESNKKKRVTLTIVRVTLLVGVDDVYISSGSCHSIGLQALDLVYIRLYGR